MPGMTDEHEAWHVTKRRRGSLVSGSRTRSNRSNGNSRQEQHASRYGTVFVCCLVQEGREREREKLDEQPGVCYPLLPISCRPRSIAGDITIQLSVRPPSREVHMPFMPTILPSAKKSESGRRSSSSFLHFVSWLLFFFFMLPRTVLFFGAHFAYAKWVVWAPAHWMSQQRTKQLYLTRILL